MLFGSCQKFFVMQSIGSTLCSLCWEKSIAYDRAEGKERRTEGEKTIIDVVIENTLIFDLFSSSIFMPLRNEEASILVVFPSPFFIRKWNECEKLNDCNVTFIVFDTREETQTENITATANLLNINYSYPFVASSSERHFTFEDFNSWVLQEEEQNQYDKVLLFDTQNTDECRSELLSKLHSLGKRPEFFVLSSDSSFSDQLSIAYSILNSEEYVIEDLILLPKGIEGTLPRLKSFWKAKPMRAPSSVTSILSQ